jgi:HSP20 family protein
MILRRVWPSRPGFESPFGELDQLRREMLRLLDGLGAGATASTLPAGVFPPMNITQDEDNVYVRAEIPGTNAKELVVSALRNRLSISGKREIASENGHVSYHRQERPEGSFSRAVELPTEVDADRIEARYSDGILALKLPKADAAKPRQIVVKT